MPNNRQMTRKIVESVLGKPLDGNHPVHHVDGNPANRRNNNLVVCEDNRYHHLLHIRADAYIACGHADWRRCNYCKEYSSPDSMYIGRKWAWHRACHNAVANVAKLNRRREKNVS